MVRECCWYGIGTGDLQQAYRPLFAGVLRIVRPIHHRGDGEAARERGGCGGDWGHWRF
jgi:hypothetical protein